MVIVGMRTKSWIDSANAYLAQPFQFGGKVIRTFSICTFDILDW